MALPNRKSPLPIASTCEGCGVCCLHMGYPTYLTPTIDAQGNQVPGEPHWEQLPDNLKQELIEYIDRYEPPADGNLDGPCIWFDLATRRCRHHQHRPRVCRDFEIGSRGCQEWRSHYQNQVTRK